jgi:hypothetical protein
MRFPQLAIVGSLAWLVYCNFVLYLIAKGERDVSKKFQMATSSRDCHPEVSGLPCGHICARD